MSLWNLKTQGLGTDSSDRRTCENTNWMEEGTKHLWLRNLTKDSTGKDWATSSMCSTKRKELNCIGYNWISKGKASRSMDRSSRGLTPVASSDTTNTKTWKTKFRNSWKNGWQKTCSYDCEQSWSWVRKKIVRRTTTSSHEEKHKKSKKQT